MSAQVLDYKRLGKQRVEALQILKTLNRGPYLCTECDYPFSYGCCGGYGKPKSTPWYNHPAVRMWKGYEVALMEYLFAMCHEWVANRGYKDTCWIKAIEVGPHPPNVGCRTKMPHWFGDKAFHLSHQSNLLRKNKTYYGKFFFGIPDNLPYIWPVQKETAGR